MRLLRLRISGYGCLSELGIDFNDGLTVVSGPNESGKSTIVDCILRMLYGFPEHFFNEERERYEPLTGGPYAASLTYRLDDGRQFEIFRDFSKADVPTQTVEADTRRLVPHLSGNKSASPGASAFGISLDVYRAAALVEAGDFTSDTDDPTKRELADRLAALVGSGGDASAAEAIERLQKAHREMGERALSTPLGKAVADAEAAAQALRRYREDYEGLAAVLIRRASLEQQAEELAARRARCSGALASAKLRSVRSKIVAAREAKAAIDAAEERRATVVTAPPAASMRRPDVDFAVEALRVSERVEADARSRVGGREDDRATLVRNLDAANAALIEKRAALSRLDAKIASDETASSGRDAISSDALASLEQEADAVDAAEAREAKLSVDAGVARHRARVSPGIAVASVVAGIAAASAGAFAHIGWLAIAGSVLAVLGVALTVVYAGAAKRRSEAIATAERAAAGAADEYRKLSTALKARCRTFGCADVAEVRAAHAAMFGLRELRGQRAAASDACVLLAQQRDALEARLTDFTALGSEFEDARRQVAERRATLFALLDELGVTGGSLDERIAACRRLLDAGEIAARADEEIAKAQTALERVLAGDTIEALDEEATLHAAEAASGAEPGEFADWAEEELDLELGRIDAEIHGTRLALHGIEQRVEEFDRTHGAGAAELEENEESTRLRRERLEQVKQAMRLAWEAIEAVKDVVHQDFTPVLNEAVSRSVAAITDGRYERAWVDQADFKIRVEIPEIGLPRHESELSTGTIEQLQFSLRAALASALGSGERVPILFDDALAHADDARLRRSLEHAAQLAREGTQIIFFTQRGDVQSLAQALANVTVFSLPGPAR